MRICSGGQTGIDQAALSAALYVDFETGGWAPKGFRTQEGDNPELGSKYHLKEHSSPLYPPRTELNVVQADGTLRIAADFESAGEKLTLKYIKKHKKPHFDVLVDNISYMDSKPNIQEVAKWIAENNIKTLNVAGNSEKTAPGIGLWGTQFLISLFDTVKNG